MLDIWIDDINIAPFIWIFILIVVLPIQLALCFRGKSKIVRLLPVIILSVLTVVSAIAATAGTDWDAVFCLVFAVYVAIMLFVCGIGWGIWAIVRKKNR